MNRLISAFSLLAIMPFMPTAASAKTATANIAVGATLVNGSNVVATYIVGDAVVTQVGTDRSTLSSPVYMKPVLRISFDLQGAYFVKRVTWDKDHRHLTIDF